jgi:hypothetical protein
MVYLLEWVCTELRAIHPAEIGAAAGSASNYEKSEFAQTKYPRYEFFKEIAEARPSASGSHRTASHRIAALCYCRSSIHFVPDSLR